MEIGLSTSLWFDEKIYSNLDLLQEAGIEYAELWFFMGHFNYALASGTGLTPNRKEIVKVKKELEKSSITAHSMHAPYKRDGLYLDLSASSKTIRSKAVDEVKTALDIGKEFNVRFAIIHPGGLFNDLSGRKPERDKVRKRLDNTVQSISTINNHAKKMDIQICVENMLKGRVGDRASDISYILKNIASDNCGMCVDTGHLNIEADIFQKTLEECKNIFAVHISDNHGINDEHNIPGNGNIDWGFLINYIESSGYSGNFMFEGKIGNTATRYQYSDPDRNEESHIRKAVRECLNGASEFRRKFF